MPGSYGSIHGQDARLMSEISWEAASWPVLQTRRVRSTAYLVARSPIMPPGTDRQPDIMPSAEMITDPSLTGRKNRGQLQHH